MKEWTTKLLCALALAAMGAMPLACATQSRAPEPEVAPRPPAAKPQPASTSGLIISGSGPYEVIINGKSHGKLVAGKSIKLDHLAPGKYEVTFVDSTSGRVAVKTTYTAELTGEGYLRVHHAPR